MYFPFHIVVLLFFTGLGSEIARAQAQVVNSTRTSTTTTPLSSASNNSNSNPTSASPSDNETTTTRTTAATTTTTTTLAPASTTTTTIKPNPKPIEPMRSPFCFCDQYMNKCEINCCCDLDCTPRDKQIFSSCTDYDLITQLGSTTSAKEQACYRQDFIYNNNTPFIVHHRSNNLFCIVSDNFKKEPVYDVPISQFKSKFVKPSHRWTSLATLNVQKLHVSTAGYKYGSLILSAQQIETHNDTELQVHYFELPSNLHGKSCLGFEPVKFLQESDTTCEYEVTGEDELAEMCEFVPSFNAKINFNPNTTIIGKIDLKSSDDKLIYFTTCKSNGDEFVDCAQMDNKIPSPKYEARQCKNVLKKAQVTFVHEGTTGILAVVVQLEFLNVSLGSASKSTSTSTPSLKFQQHFKVRFLWKDEFQALLSTSVANEPNTNATLPKKPIPDLPKSGNPGYLIGKEVITGTLVTNEDVKSKKSSMVKEIGKSDNETLIRLQDTTPDDKDPFGVALFHDSTATGGYYLSIINAGACHQKNRRPILFGMNMKSSCELPVTRYKYCEELKADLGFMLLGTYPTNFTKRVVASFGNPFILQTIPDWIPITILNNPFLSTPNSVSLLANGCNNLLITSLRIQIIFAYVGPVVFPHAQIREVVYEFGEPLGNLRPAHITNKGAAATARDKSLSTSVTLSTTVEFQDVTSVPTHKLAHWPTISIQLPSDFFYPFSSSSGGWIYANKGRLAIMQVFVVVIIHF